MLVWHGKIYPFPQIVGRVNALGPRSGFFRLTYARLAQLKTETISEWNDHPSQPQLWEAHRTREKKPYEANSFFWLPSTSVWITIVNKGCVAPGFRLLVWLCRLNTNKEQWYPRNSKWLILKPLGIRTEDQKHFYVHNAEMSAQFEKTTEVSTLNKQIRIKQGPLHNIFTQITFGAWTVYCAHKLLRVMSVAHPQLTNVGFCLFFHILCFLKSMHWETIAISKESVEKQIRIKRAPLLYMFMHTMHSETIGISKDSVRKIGVSVGHCMLQFQRNQLEKPQVWIKREPMHIHAHNAQLPFHRNQLGK